MDKITLKAARVNAGLTQEQAAKAAGVGRNTIISWERGRKQPTPLKLLGLSALYGVEVKDFLLPEAPTLSDRHERAI